MLVQTSKQGMIFMLNRAAEPVAKVEERPVPAGNVKGGATRRPSPTPSACQ